MGGTVERTVAGEKGEGALNEAEKVGTDAAFGVAGAAAGRVAGEIGERVGGAEELEQVKVKLGWKKLGSRHAARLAVRQQQLAVVVQRSGKAAEEVVGSTVDTVHRIEEPSTCKDSHPDTCGR